MLWLSFLVTLVTASDGEEREKWQFSESLRTETHRCTSLEFDFIGELRYIDYLTNGCLVERYISHDGPHRSTINCKTLVKDF
ncbi:hypothetical protein ASPSYDRAFT_39265 [Aspergillus sydowii CBS 593.65]|uniref:Cyanovirin-N domain-containing protein n=1 Tax=Aspergillus sydowii CBS 593.65 TaxID=1036612 RepID=A0A1L9TYS9_9EURO|nr:uncharacterized protein ASPSYDRAFT_39265 [Aspergillus sydowii CBS 593.65]OJJ64538.1 hypothetical protein ASPSYDRAFT_39265 [Aspergillus sydowii CBS 593.65]